MDRPSEDVPAEHLPADEPSELSTGFSDRVVILFIGTVVTTGLGVFVGFLLARLLGPSGKGSYYFLSLLPVTAMVVVQLGLPQAVSFYAARGKVLGLNAKAVVLTIVMSAIALVVTALVWSLFSARFAEGVTTQELVLAMASLPMALGATFTAGIIVGRQAVRSYVALGIGQSILSAILFVTIVGILGQGVAGALLAFLIASTLGGLGYFLGSVRAARLAPPSGAVTYRELFQYGLPLYPGSLTEYFGLRLDVFLLAALLASPAVALGWYSMAVTMSQLAAFLPTAVSTLFFPHVAGSERSVADREVALVSRVTVLTTTIGAALLIPIGSLAILTFLPAFTEALPAFIVLLPAIVALGVTRVLSSYLIGVGRTGWTSAVNVGAVIVNIAANIVLIPRYGIVGAAAASFLSYIAAGIAFAVLAGRLSGTPFAAFWLPRMPDVRFLVTTSVGVGRRLLRRAPA